MDEDDSLFLCTHCTEDHGLAVLIKDFGAEGTCSFCHESGDVMPLDDVAEECHEVVRSYFGLSAAEPDTFERLAPGEWERSGTEPIELLADIAGVSMPVAEKLVEYLSELYGYMAVKDGEEDPFGIDARYVEIPVSDAAFQEDWLFLERELRERSRFFNPAADRVLGNIFSGIRDLRTFQGQPVVVTVSPDDPNAVFWRARMFMKREDAEEALVDPSALLGPPPPEKARAGRMNPVGVAAFYGSQELDVCLAELRPPVGSWVVACQFRPTRPLCLLDLPALEAVYEEGSYFGSGLMKRRERAAFLSRFGALASRPVLPGDEDLGYLPTQVIAEYLAEKLKIDGMVYPSTQAGGDRSNVVLFHRAARVQQLPADESLELTGDIQLSEDGIEPFVWAERAAPQNNLADEAPDVDFSLIADPEWLLSSVEAAPPDDPREESLLVVPGSVTVSYITGVTISDACAKARALGPL